MTANTSEGYEVSRAPATGSNNGSDPDGGLRGTREEGPLVYSSLFSAHPSQERETAIPHPQPARVTAEVKAWEKGNHVSLSYPERSRKSGGGSREGVANKGRTRRSCARARKLLGRIDRSEIPLLITLTYGDYFPSDPETWKDDLDKFARRMDRQFRDCSFFWVVELQRRKSGDCEGRYAPHFHLLVWGCNLNPFREWMPVAWYECCTERDFRQIRVHRREEACQEARSSNAVKGYVQKYVTKAEKGAYDDAYPDGIGGWWGARYRDRLPLTEPTTLHLTERGARKAMRLLLRYVNAEYRSKGVQKRMRGGYTFGFSASVIDPGVWVRALVRLGYAVREDGERVTPRNLSNGGYLPGKPPASWMEK